MNKFLLLFLLAALKFSAAQSNSWGGLLFNSQNVVNDQRTSLNLTKSGKLSLPQKLTLSFEMSIEDSRYYGYILRLRTKEFKASLLYVQFENKDTSYLQLIVNDKKLKNKISVPKNIYVRGNWFPVKLEFDGEKGQCFLSINNGSGINSQINLGRDKSAEIIFGIDRMDGAPDGDVPRMCIRNIKIFNEHERLLHFWPLNESSGFIATDVQSGLDASVINPNWLVNNHYKFKNVGRVGPFSKIFPDEAIPIVRTKNDERFLFVAKDYHHSFNIASYKTEKVKFSKPLLHPDNVIVSNNENNKLYAYYRGQGNVAVYNDKDRSWSRVDTAGEHDGHFYYHNSFINPLNGDLCMINGYGWYTFNNILQKYDFTGKKWMQIKTKGDSLVPRLAAAMCKKNDSGDFFIFGGIGNMSGKQEESAKGLTDLYLLSMRDTTIKKIGELKNVPKEFVAYPSMHYDSTHNQLYMMGNTKYGVKITSKKLYRCDINSGSFEAVSDTLLCSDNIGTPIFYSKKFSELYAFERVNISADSFYVDINSLLFPPITENEYNNLHKADFTFSYFSEKKMILVIVFLILLALTFSYLYRRKKINIRKQDLYLRTDSQQTGSIKNSIFLFGGFQIFDKDGNEITKDFSPKLKQMFLLLLTKSYNRLSNGISTEKLSAYLWPDSNPEQIKNNRNVAISKLRTILENLDSADVKVEKNMMALSLSGNVYCDYIHLRKILNSGGSVKDQLSVVRDILSRGEFLEDISYEWFDGQKVQFAEETISTLKSAALKNDLDKSSKLALADSILFLDSVNQDGLSMKIKTYIDLGDHKLARASYDHFKKEYFRLYAEEYTKSYSDFSE